MVFLTGKSPNIYGHIRCIDGIFDREITKYTVIYGVYTEFLAGKSPNIGSYTVYIRYCWQGNHQIYGHIRCIYGIIGRGITKYTVIHGVYTEILAGKSPNIGSYTVYTVRTIYHAAKILFLGVRRAHTP
jgi:uncharacterized protein YfaP (DUF2135 family)